MSSIPSGVSTLPPVTMTVTMDSDLSAKSGYGVNLDTTDNKNVNLAANATAGFPYPLYDAADGSVTKATGSVVLSGGCKVKLAGTVAPGDRLTTDSNGKWIATTTDHQFYGCVALAIGASGDMVDVFVERGMVSAA
jgi:hypothetical protein